MSGNQDERLQLLNVGCGRHFHPAWRNIDVVSYHPQVEAHDLRLGLPAKPGQYDMVYHSHVLEHLTPADAQRLIEECYRVLKPGGVLRVVVPDLEFIARSYITALEDACAEPDNPVTEQQRALRVAKYEWIKLELLDQMVRQTSGGLMGPAIQSATGEMASFIGQRLGHEVNYAKAKVPEIPANESSAPPAPPMAKPTRPPARVRWARKFIKWMLGKDALKWLDVGQFLDSGEVHRWMYDRFSLQELTSRCRFQEFRVCSAIESYLPGFAEFEMDQVDGVVRKPDSIFAECRKPQQRGPR